ncbi:MAG: hypothetical protein GMKNLPBB_00340 [Myxococcota bacterium]|nr:hypothetical protein [Myxococcota bacterium]
MARIDNYLKYLNDPAVNDIFLVAGKMPVMLQGKRVLPLSSTTLSNDDVLSLCSEIAGDHEHKLISQAEADWIYELEGVGKIEVSVRRHQGESRSRFRKAPAGGSSGGGPTPPGPVAAGVRPPSHINTAAPPVVPAPVISVNTPYVAPMNPQPAQTPYVAPLNPPQPPAPQPPAPVPYVAPLNPPQPAAPVPYVAPLNPAVANQGMEIEQTAHAPPPAQRRGTPAAQARPSREMRGHQPKGRSTLTMAAIPGAADRPMSQARIIPLLAQARKANATDLHIISGEEPKMRICGQLVIPVGAEPMEPAYCQELLMEILTEPMRKMLIERGNCDFSYEVSRVGRFRGNVSHSRNGLNGTFRCIPASVPELSQLNLPGSLRAMVEHHKGIVLVTGPTGSGKTTTLAALVNQLNMTRPHHIITVEDPIEYVYPVGRAIVSQRELGRHTLAFSNALRSALREDPDIIVVGDLRDHDTIEMAIHAAETGHLVLATMNTSSAHKTIERLIDSFPPNEQPQIRITLSTVLKGVLTQRLIPMPDGKTMIPALEILIGTPSLANLIREDKVFQVPQLIERSRALGMCQLDDYLVQLVRDKRITEQSALDVARDSPRLLKMLRMQEELAAKKTPPAAAQPQKRH